MSTARLYLYQDIPPHSKRTELSFVARPNGNIFMVTFYNSPIINLQIFLIYVKLMTESIQNYKCFEFLFILLPVTGK